VKRAVCKLNGLHSITSISSKDGQESRNRNKKHPVFVIFKSKHYLCVINLKTMDETTKDKVEYIIAFISDFAKTHSLSTMQAYRYLERFKGLEFIDKFYGVLHTFSFEDAIDDLTAYCHRKGGALV